MLLVRETQGDTLRGIIDGSNRTYTTTLGLGSLVNVFVNGQLKLASRADGYTQPDAYTITFKQALLPGDTLEVEYTADVPTGGGASGGVPMAPSAVALRPTAVVSQTLTGPTATGQTQRPAAVLAQPLPLPTSNGHLLRPAQLFAAVDDEDS